MLRPLELKYRGMESSQRVSGLKWHVEILRGLFHEDHKTMTSPTSPAVIDDKAEQQGPSREDNNDNNC